MSNSYYFLYLLSTYSVSVAVIKELHKFFSFISLHLYLVGNFIFHSFTDEENGQRHTAHKWGFNPDLSDAKNHST